MSSETDQQTMERIEDQAAEWVLRFNEGSLSDQTLAQWRSWVDSSPHHLTAYEKMSKLWAVADELPSELPVAEKAAERETLVKESWRDRWATFWQTLARPQVAAVASLCLVAVFWGVYSFDSKDTKPFVRVGHIAGIQTEVGSHKEYRLPDGSMVELAGDTQIELAYSDNERRIRLVKGEALFDVESNPDRPFIVAAGVGEYQALGTVFNVNAGVSQSTLTVVEGMVQASTGDTKEGYSGSNYPRLVAGESLSISDDGTISDVAQVDPKVALGWRTGLFTFTDVPLSEVFATINRYRQTPVEASPELNKLKYTGSVHRDSVDGLLEVLPEVFPVSVTRSGDKVIVRLEN